MENKKYDNWLVATACLGVITLVCGCILSLFSAEKPQMAESTVVQNFDVASEFNAIIETNTPESYESLITNMVALRNEYPDTLKFFTAGYSEGKKEIPMLTMGTGDKKALMIGGIHAREHITTKYILRVIEEYCHANENTDGILNGYNIKELLKKYTVYIIPCVNPDGLEIIRSREAALSNVRITDLEDYKANKNGVDLNRNFPLAWESIDNGVTSPYSYYFKGYKSGSESETKALMTLCEENQFSFMLSIHIKGNCIFWGDTYNTENNSLYKAFAEEIAASSGFRMTEPTLEATDYGGGFENWFRHTYQMPGLCLELSHYTNIISPCDNKNYTDFDIFVNYGQSKNALAAAMQSNLV